MINGELIVDNFAGGRGSQHRDRVGNRLQCGYCN